MEIKDTIFYKIVRPVVNLYIKIFYHPTIVGIENIPKEGRIVLAGNHTKWLDPVMLVGITKRQLHFLAKDELFHGFTKWIVKGMGCIPVNRRIHDHDALNNAYKFLEKDLCSLLHDWHKKIEVGKETHSIEVLPHSRHLLFPGIDKRL